MADKKSKVSKRLFISNWSSIIDAQKPINVNMMRPGNFYKIDIYKYADGVTRDLSGVKTTHIFFIGKFRQGKDQYVAALKLANVNPEYFFTDIKQAFKFKPLTEEKISEVQEEYEHKLDQFRKLLLSFPMDGRNLFAIVKQKKRIYQDNYREYKLDSIKKSEYLSISESYLVSKLTLQSEKSGEKKERRDATNTRRSEVKKDIAKPDEPIKADTVIGKKV